jgi:hypothetical protein
VKSADLIPHSGGLWDDITWQRQAPARLPSSDAAIERADQRPGAFFGLDESIVIGPGIPL